jgi:hypothetical protein
MIDEQALAEFSKIATAAYWRTSAKNQGASRTFNVGLTLGSAEGGKC